MQGKIKERVLQAFLLVMRPIVRILLRYGIGYREFAEVVKTSFVEVASSDFGLRGRPTNVSRVAVMTGLTRKEIKRIRDKIASGDSNISVKTTPLSDVLHHWHAQAEFTDASGAPRILPFSGGRGSFSSLVKQFGGDIPAGAMRMEMKRVGVIKEGEKGELEVINRTFKSENKDENLLTVLVHGVYAQLSNVCHNFDPSRTDATWPNRIAYTQSIHTPDTKQLRRITKDRIIDFVESIDDVFMAYESLAEDDEKGAKAVAVGVYYFEETDENAKYDW